MSMQYWWLKFWSGLLWSDHLFLGWSPSSSRFFPAKERDNVTRKGTPEGNKKVLSIRLHLNCHCNWTWTHRSRERTKNWQAPKTTTTTKNWRVNIAINHWRWLLLLLLLLALDDELNSSSSSSSFLLVAANNNKHRERRGRGRDDGTKKDWGGDMKESKTKNTHSICWAIERKRWHKKIFCASAWVVCVHYWRVHSALNTTVPLYLIYREALSLSVSKCLHFLVNY